MAVTANSKHRLRGRRVQLAPGRSATNPDSVRRAEVHDQTRRHRGGGSNRVVPGIGDVQVAFRIHRDTLGAVESVPILAPDTPWAARNRRHHTAGRNLPDRMVVGVGDIQCPGVVHRNGLRLTETRGAARAIIRPEQPGRPASVVTTPPAVIFRIVWLLVSATYTLPAALTATPGGKLNRAVLPVPSMFPALPRQTRERRNDAAGCNLPDRVIVGSATYRYRCCLLPFLEGPESRGAARSVSASRRRPARPASVVTTPAAVIVRIVFLPSATYTVPPLSTAIPSGKLNRAALPVPSLLPGLFARPANVVTSPAAVTLRIVELSGPRRRRCRSHRLRRPWDTQNAPSVQFHRRRPDSRRSLPAWSPHRLA